MLADGRYHPSGMGDAVKDGVLLACTFLHCKKQRVM